MNVFWEYYGVWFDRVGIPACALLVTMVVGYIVRAVVVHRLEALAARTTSQVDDVIIRAIRGPMLIWFVMLGLFIAVHISDIPDSYQVVAGKILLSLGILSITLVLSNLAANIIQLYMPDKEIAVPVDVSVHFRSDLQRVEAATREVAMEVMKTVPGGVPSFDPVVRFSTLGDSGIGLTVILRAREFADQFTVKHDFIKRLVARYAKEGIVIPYPVRAMNTSQERGE